MSIIKLIRRGADFYLDVLSNTKVWYPTGVIPIRN